MSEQLARSVKMLEAADFSEEMIREAKKHPSSARLHYSVQDATNLTYADASFDAVVISNALHIMPEPEKALAEIRRVLKQDGILFAPTFTAAESLLGRTRIHIMELSGFRVFHRWTPQEYLRFLQDNGFAVTDREVLGGVLALTYAEAKKRKSKMLKITVQVDGMMCGMCESHVNDAVRKAFSVKKVTSSHSKGQTTIIAENDIDENALRSAIGATGYEVKKVSKEPYEKKGLFHR